MGGQEIATVRGIVRPTASREGRPTMARNDVDKPSGYPDSWPGLVSLLFKLGTESWVKLLRVSILLVLLGGVVWLIASAR